MSPTNCTLCNAAPTTDGANYSRCSGCLSAVYCSKAFQIVDWTYHKHICKEYAFFIAANPRPSDTHKLAILLPVDQKMTEMIWIQCGPRLGNPHIGHLITSKEVKVPVRHFLAFKHPKLRRFDLKHNVELVIGDQQDGASNVCVKTVVKSKPKFDWKGSIVVLSDDSDEYQDENEAVTYKDITASDFRLVIDFLMRFDGVEIDSQGVGNKPDIKGIQDKVTDFLIGDDYPEKIQAVKINCKGDMHFFGAKMHVEEDIEKDDPVFSMKPTGFTERIGLPMMGHKCPRNTEWSRGEKIWREERNGSDPYNNQRATIMNINTDPGAENFGFADLQEWDLCGVGSVIVARKDQ
jgi:hypothetical protein